jgi:hypothetical protein
MTTEVLKISVALLCHGISLRIQDEQKLSLPEIYFEAVMQDATSEH